MTKYFTLTTSSYIFGIRAILEAIHSKKVAIDKVILQQQTSSDLMRELVQTLRNNNIPVSYVPLEKLHKLSKGNHQGAVARISPIAFESLESMVEKAFQKTSTPLFILLDEISDTRNLGAIIRTAACTGVNGIILPQHGSAPINADTVKTSAGGIFEAPLCKTAHVKDAVFYLQGSGIHVVAATEKATQTLYQADFKQPLALILGSEDRGINPSVLKLVDASVKLPITGHIASLNVSVACGAFLYEIIRQRTET